MATAMTTKEMTAHLRKRIRVAGIQARVSFYESCGSMCIKVTPASVAARFSDEQQRMIRLIAQVNGLTKARGLAIDLDRMTDDCGTVFYQPEHLIA